MQDGEAYGRLMAIAAWAERNIDQLGERTSEGAKFTIVMLRTLLDMIGPPVYIAPGNMELADPDRTGSIEGRAGEIEWNPPGDANANEDGDKPDAAADVTPYKTT